MSGTHDSRKVAILLSTYNGEQFLTEQLRSILEQTHKEWVLYWRDDGSNDGTVRLMRDFLAGPGHGRCVAPEDGGTRLGVTHSYLALLRAAAEDGAEVLAFADQDDVWLPEKLSLGLAALGRGPHSMPALYCARQILADRALRRIRLSATTPRTPCFAAALTQNIATGCTVILNRPAIQLVARSHAPGASLHDWWCYLLVAGAGGRLVVDDTPVVLYRQHTGNFVGAPSSMPRRALAALRRGPGVFMNVFRQHVAALSEQSHLLSATARQQLHVVSRALESSPIRRLAALRIPGFCRQTWPETLLFRLWFMLG
jgi:glycosyltransferase involved in cell wall biosynthesis